MGSHTVYKIILTLKIIYWPMYLNEYIKTLVFKIYIGTYQYSLLKLRYTAYVLLV